ncbi:MAG: hypothetical protein ABID09_04700 [Candidatus Omnitrophota bacterium]
MKKEIIKRALVLSLILVFTCEIGLRVRLAYLYRNPEWLLYHQFKLRTEEEISEDLPQYYKDNMFKPYKLVYTQEAPKGTREIMTVESSALRSIRRQLEKIVKDRPDLEWIDRFPNENKEIVFSNNNIVLYELLVYPDIHNTLKREARVLKRFFGAKLDDFLYHNLAFYMHIDENINFTSMKSDKMLEGYLLLLKSREEPFCKSIYENKFKNVIYVITPNAFIQNSAGGRVYLKYVKAAYDAILEILERYDIPYIDLMNEEVEKSDFTDYFHLSPTGGERMSAKILEFIKEKGL